jgi:hypothetical protein
VRCVLVAQAEKPHWLLLSLVCIREEARRQHKRGHCGHRAGVHMEGGSEMLQPSPGAEYANVVGCRWHLRLVTVTLE